MRKKYYILCQKAQGILTELINTAADGLDYEEKVLCFPISSVRADQSGTENMSGQYF